MHQDVQRIKQRFKLKITKFILCTLVIMGIILALLRSSHNYYEEIAIKSQQQNILNIVTTVSSQLETYFIIKDGYLRTIIEDSEFLWEFKELNRGNPIEVRLIELLFKMGQAEYTSIELIDSKGVLLRVYTDNPGYEYRQGTDIVQAVRSHNPIYFVETLGDRSINITRPVKEDEKLYGFVRMKLNTEHIYNVYLADYQLNQKGYISLKDKEGRLFLHPSRESIGEEVVAVRKRQYPDYDWSELENIVQRQLRRETGVGVYHSIWPGDSTRVRKINGFTPCYIGDTFIILNFSIDYKETMFIFQSITRATIWIAILLVMISLLAIFYIYMVELQRSELALEAVYFEELKEKNAMIMHQAKFASMGEMIATIAHQLKQPLNALKISLYNIEDYHLLEEEDATYLETLLQANHRLIDKISKTIDDFKFFFKPQRESTMFNIWEAIDFAIELNIARINDLEIQVAVSGDRKASIVGESNVLSQVMLNLINLLC